MPTFEDRNVEIHVRFEPGVMALVDELWGPPTDPAEFLRYCWRRYGTGRRDPDCVHARLDLDDPELCGDLNATGCGECFRLLWCIRFAGGAAALPWSDFNLAAKRFLRIRYARRASVRHKASCFQVFDRAVRGLLTERAPEAVRAARERLEAASAAFHGPSVAAGADNH